MTLSDMLAQAPAPKGSPICGVAGLASRLSKKDGKAFLKAADGETTESGSPWAIKDLAKAMTAAGYTITEHVVGRHRRGECKCLKA